MSAICKKCQNNVKLYGKPSTCEYCNIVAAFIGSRCQRCTNSEHRWGEPVSCEQCRQRCAFRRSDESRRKVDGRTLCWLCTLSYKRVKARAQKREHSSGGSDLPEASGGSARRRRSGGSSRPHRPDGGREQSTDSPANVSSASAKRISTAGRAAADSANSHKRRREAEAESQGSGGPAAAALSRHASSTSAGGSAAAFANSRSPARSPEKKARVERSTSVTAAGSGASLATATKASNLSSNLGGDTSLSENMITINRLHEEVEGLKKQLVQKEQQVLQRDRQLTEVKAEHYRVETELRSKIASMQKSHSDAIENFQAKNNELLKQLATLSKSVKKVPVAASSATNSPAR